MTFGDLLTDLRTRKLNESGTSYFSDSSDLLPMLAQAERAIAAAFGFPRSSASGNTMASVATITAPADLLAITPKGLSLNGLVLRHLAFPELEFYKQQGTGVPRYYSYDPAIGGNINLAPVPSGAFPYRLDYVVKLAETRVSGATPWNGLFPQFHELISLYAAAQAYEKGAAGYEMAGYWVQRASLRMQDFAAFLAHHGLKPPPNVFALLRLPKPGGEA